MSTLDQTQHLEAGEDTVLVVRCHHEYFKQRPDELEMRAGDYVVVLSQDIDTWWVGLNLHTNDRGWFPKDFVKVVRPYPKSDIPKLQKEMQAKSQSVRAKKSPYIMYVEVLFDYDPQDDDELELRVGEVIGVLKEIEGWYQGDKHGQQGIFPANFVRTLTAEEVAALQPKAASRGSSSKPPTPSHPVHPPSEALAPPPSLADPHRLSAVVGAFPLPGMAQSTMPSLPVHPSSGAPPAGPIPPVPTTTHLPPPPSAAEPSAAPAKRASAPPVPAAGVPSNMSLPPPPPPMQGIPPLPKAPSAPEVPHSTSTPESESESEAAPTSKRSSTLPAPGAPLPVPGAPMPPFGAPVPRAQGTNQARVVRDYEAQGPGELNLFEGDIITIIAQRGDLWKGDSHGKIGFFPPDAVEVLQPADDGPAEAAPTDRVDGEGEPGAEVPADAPPAEEQPKSFKLAAYGVRQGGIGSLFAGGVVPKLRKTTRPPAEEPRPVSPPAAAPAPRQMDASPPAGDAADRGEVEPRASPAAATIKPMLTSQSSVMSEFYLDGAGEPHRAPQPAPPSRLATTHAPLDESESEPEGVSRRNYSESDDEEAGPSHPSPPRPEAQAAAGSQPLEEEPTTVPKLPTIRTKDEGAVAEQAEAQSDLPPEPRDATTPDVPKPEPMAALVPSEVDSEDDGHEADEESLASRVEVNLAVTEAIQDTEVVGKSNDHEVANKSSTEPTIQPQVVVPPAHAPAVTSDPESIEDVNASSPSTPAEVPTAEAPDAASPRDSFTPEPSSTKEGAAVSSDDLPESDTTENVDAAPSSQLPSTPFAPVVAPALAPLAQGKAALRPRRKPDPNLLRKKSQTSLTATLAKSIEDDKLEPMPVEPLVPAAVNPEQTPPEIPRPTPRGGRVATPFANLGLGSGGANAAGQTPPPLGAKPALPRASSRIAELQRRFAQKAAADGHVISGSESGGGSPRARSTDSPSPPPFMARAQSNEIPSPQGSPAAGPRRMGSRSNSGQFEALPLPPRPQPVVTPTAAVNHDDIRKWVESRLDVFRTELQAEIRTAAPPTGEGADAPADVQSWVEDQLSILRNDMSSARSADQSALAELAGQMKDLAQAGAGSGESAKTTPAGASNQQLAQLRSYFEGELTELREDLTTQLDHERKLRTALRKEVANLQQQVAMLCDIIEERGAPQ